MRNRWMAIAVCDRYSAIQGTGVPQVIAPTVAIDARNWRTRWGRNERETITEALSSRPYDRDSRAFVSWLGTICYLTRGAIEATLSSLAMACAPGSRVVFDYFQPRSTMSPPDLALFELLDQGGTRRGEPMQTLLDSEEVAGILHSAGFCVVEDLAASEIRRRYLRHRSDGLDIPGFVRLCCAERTV